MARGIQTVNDRMSTTLDGQPFDRVWEEVQASLTEFNRGRDALSALFTFTSTLPSEPVAQTSDLADFEEASEFGVPKSMRALPGVDLLGAPLNWFDSTTRFTQDFLRDADVAQVQAQHNYALEADNRLVFRKAQQALFTRTGIGTRSANENGTSIYSLWDGASDSKPPVFAGQSFAPGHDHYLVTESADLNGGHLKGAIRTVTEHGYGIGAGERMVLLVHPNQGDVIRNLRADPTSPDTAPYDFIPSQGAPAYLSTEQIIGDRPPAKLLELEVIGSFGSAYVIEDYQVPSGYVMAVAFAGVNSPRNVLTYRQHKRPEYQGLRLIPGPSTYRLVESAYSHGFGYGVRNRGAAAVLQVTTSSTYSAPVL